MTGKTPYVLAISLEPLDASTTLFLGHLAEQLTGALQVVRYADPHLGQKVAAASAIILVRGLFEFGAAVWAARAFGIPLYYFVDDNFILLREQRGPWSPFVRRYSAANVRRQLRGFHGVLLSSESLIDYFRSEKLHHELLLFPPVEWRQPLPKPPARPASVVAFFGGRHLHDVLLGAILPAVRRLATVHPLTLIAAGVAEPIAASPGLTVVEQLYNPSYEEGLRQLAKAGVDVLVHPSAPGLLNDRFKNPHALISAKALGAIPVVSGRPPYSALRAAGVALLCDDSSESWHQGLSQALDHSQRPAIAERLAAFCSSHYDGTKNREAIKAIVSRHEAPSARLVPLRSIVVRAFMLLGRVRQGLSRLRQGAMAASVSTGA